MDDGRRVVLKVLKPARSYKIKREIRVLQARSHTAALHFYAAHPAVYKWKKKLFLLLFAFHLRFIFEALSPPPPRGVFYFYISFFFAPKCAS